MNIQSITERSMITPQGEEVILFLLQPTNVSVLSREGLRARVNALMNVLKGFAEVELLCLNSRESFEHNKQYLTRRIEQEPVPQIRALLEQDLRHLDEIQSRTATAREFMLVIRPRNIGERDAGGGCAGSCGSRVRERGEHACRKENFAGLRDCGGYPERGFEISLLTRKSA